MSGSSHHEHDPSLAGQVRAATGESVFNCYQCGKCSAGCPLAEEMDCAPNQVLRLLQLGLPALEEEALKAQSIWLCLACETCATRCPQEVSIPRVMDYLREEALRRGVAHPQAKDILAFHRSFLDSIRKNGRLHEVGLISSYKMRTMHLFQDVLVAPKLLMRGKLKIMPHKIQGRDAIAAMFDRCAAQSGASGHAAETTGHHDEADKK
jgi:heterodisulfide reductase subunit C2